MTCIFSAEQGKDFAKKIYDLIIKEKIQIVYLHGEMGTGKTTFVKNILHTIDPHCTVTSPTYSYLNEYIIDGKYIWHFDLYRIENKEELIDFGLLDYLNRDYGIAFIEWAEKLQEEHIKKYHSLSLHFLYVENENERACLISL